MANATRRSATSAATRRDVRVQPDPGVEIAVRRVLDLNADRERVPILLVHGARAPSIASFDLDVPNGSLAADLAGHGHPVYLMDARGYGGSTRPPEMSSPPGDSEPLSRSETVVHDIDAVTAHILAEQSVEQIAVMGWATGSQWMTHFAAVSPHHVSHLAVYNGVWPVAGDWPLGDNLEDSEHPGQLRRGALPGYGFATAPALLGRWNDNIPIENLDDWRDPAVAEAYAATAIASDPEAHKRVPPSIRTPLGPLADTFLLSRGRAPFDPGRITARVLVARSELDFWSRPIDIEAPAHDLINARSIEYMNLKGATHFVHLDRPERGRDELIKSLLAFLREG
jgi:pimeloyl-ACP methyl ester carboxylesterase